VICTRLGRYGGLEVPRPVVQPDEALYRQKIQEVLESHRQCSTHTGEPVLPKLTDDLVAGMGIAGICTAAQLEQFTRAYLLAEERRKADEALRRAVIDLVIEDSEFEFSEDEVPQKVMELAAGFCKTLLHQGITLEDHLRTINSTLEDFFQSLREKVVYQFQYRSVVEKIAATEAILVSDEEAMQEIMAAARTFELGFQEFILASPDGYEGLKADVLKKKVVEFIISRVNFK
jgi:FKBP-type peptidyl-prolyl cis-trans isomerase (trigger factor)